MQSDNSDLGNKALSKCLTISRSCKLSDNSNQMMQSDNSDLGNKALSKVAEIGLSSQLHDEGSNRIKKNFGNGYSPH
jgi:hypothetical protein